MKTLEEIKSIIYPKEEVGMKEVIKDLLKQTHKEGELVTFERIYLYSLGDSYLYINGVALINNNLIVSTEMDGYDADAVLIGTVSDSETNEKTGFKIPKKVFINIGKCIFENKTKIEFDFKSMKGLGSYYFCGDDFEDGLDAVLPCGKTLNEVVDSFINGKEKGYVEW